MNNNSKNMKINIITHFKSENNKENYTLFLDLLYRIYETHKKDWIILHNPIIIMKCRELLLDMNCFPNRYYIGLLEYIINNYTKMTDDMIKFIKSMLMVFEENAITGIVNITNKRIINKLKENKISNTHVINFIKI